MLAYPVKLTRDKESGGFVVTFPDIPEAITQGETVEEALEMAQDALETALDFYLEDRRAVPAPSKPKHGQRLVYLPVNIDAKVNGQNLPAPL
jgi:antitoxin HicB